MKKVLAIALLAISLASCTENSRVKNFGGEGTLNLPKGQKLITVTWKDTQLWYLTRSMNSTDVAETYTFHEESSFGVLQGTYNIVETK
jgi:hypothetical protein